MDYAIITAANRSRDAIDYWNLAAALGALLVLIIYTSLTYWQAKLTKASLKETRKSNRATKKSNRLTAVSNREQRDFLIKTNRSHLVMPYVVDGIPLAITPCRLILAVGRSGVCPAFNVVGRSGLIIVPDELREAIPVKDQDQRAMISVAVMQSSSMRIDLGRGHTLTPGDVRAVKEGRLFLYYVGMFSYEDGMDNDRKIMEFWLAYDASIECFMLAPFGQRST